MKTIALALFMAGEALSQADNVSFEDKHLATIPEGVSASLITFSPDGRKVFYRGMTGGRAAVWVNNAKGPEYATIGDELRVSATGQVAYTGNNGGQWFPVVNQQPGAPGTYVGCPVFSPDGKKYAFKHGRETTGINDTTSHSVYTGTQRGPDFLTVSNPFWSADSTVLAYPVQIGKSGTAQLAFHTMFAMVVNGKPGPEADLVTAPVFAPKGNRMAYTLKGSRAMTWSLYVDGKPTAEADEFSTPVWSPDGKRIACRARTGRQWSLVVDGKKGPAYEILGDPFWSKDGKHVVHFAIQGDKAFVMQDGNELESIPGGQIGPGAFSPDGTQLAYPARATTGKWMLVNGPKKGTADLDLIDSITWSPDGKQIACRAGWKYKWIIVVNDGKNELFDALAPSGPVWSPDSQKLAYAAKKDSKWYMVVAYRRQEAFDEILTPPRWSADGKKVAFGGRKGQDLLWRVSVVPE